MLGSGLECTIAGTIWSEGLSRYQAQLTASRLWCFIFWIGCCLFWHLNTRSASKIWDRPASGTLCWPDVRWRWLPVEPSSPACDCGSCFSAVESFQQHSVFSQNGQSCSWQNTKLVGGSISRTRCPMRMRLSQAEWQRPLVGKEKPQHKTEPLCQPGH